jgi:hypothetical protein
MSEDLKPLLAGPSFALRKEVVAAPELGGAVIVRGLMASEAFALGALRAQATRRIRQARQEHLQRAGKLQPGAPEPEFDAPDLDFGELRTYGRYISQMLSCAVVAPNELALYTADEWEVVAQHHPALVARLQSGAEKLSGLSTEDVEKN